MAAKRMNSVHHQLMLDDITNSPRMIRDLADHLESEAPLPVQRVLVVAYGANLTAARLVEHTLAQRGVSVRCAVPEQAHLLDGEMLVCITRSAGNDAVLAYMHQELVANPELHCMLLTAQTDLSVAVRPGENVRIVHLPLTSSAPSIPTQSVLAIFMALDALGRNERLAAWRAFADEAEAKMGEMIDRTERQAAVVGLSERVFFIGDEIMQGVGECLSLTFMQAAERTALVLPLSFGLSGPLARFGAADCVTLLGNGPQDLFGRYRQFAGYSINVRSLLASDPVTAAAETLLQGQLLAMACMPYKV